jgi:hypothetical protein
MHLDPEVRRASSVWHLDVGLRLVVAELDKCPELDSNQRPTP